MVQGFRDLEIGDLGIQGFRDLALAMGRASQTENIRSWIPGWIPGWIPALLFWYSQNSTFTVLLLANFPRIFHAGIPYEIRDFGFRVQGFRDLGFEIWV